MSFRRLLTSFVMLVVVFAISDVALRQRGVTRPSPVEATASGATTIVPTNFDFSSNSGEVGTPPANHDFADGGDDWTKTGGNVSYSNGYASITSGYTRVKSSGFTVDTAADVIRINFRTPGTGFKLANVIIRRASDDAQLRSYTLVSGSVTINDFEERQFPIGQWAGTDIKFEVYRVFGKIEFDDVVQAQIAPNWDTNNGDIRLKEGGPTGQYASFEDTIYSSDFHLVDSRIELSYAYPGSANHYLRVRVRETAGDAILSTTYAASCLPCSRGWTILVATVDPSDIGKQVYLELWSFYNDTELDNVGVNLLSAPLAAFFTGGAPVSTSTGQISYSHTDVLIPGKGIPLEFTRTYRSMSDQDGSLGYGWTHNYAWSLRIDADSSVMVRYPHGGSAYFEYSGGTLTAPANVFDTLVKNGDNTYTYTTVSAVEFDFSTAGKLTGITGRNGHETSISYDVNGDIDEVEDPGGRKLEFTVDGSGRITAVADPLSRNVGFTYDASGDLTVVNDVKSGTTTYAYSNHLMTSLTDSLSHVADQNIFDTANRVVEQTTPAGTRCYYYGSGPTYTSTACPAITPAAAAGQTVVVDPRGKKTTYDFDTKFRTTSVTDHDANVTTFAYDSSDNRTCVTDDLSNRTGYTYDSDGNVTGIIDGENTDTSCDLKSGGDQWTFSYTSLNDVDLATDPRGNLTDYIYDVNGNLTDVVRKDSSSVVLLWTCFTVPTSGSDQGLVTEIIESTTLTNCSGDKTKLEYDTYGNVTAQIDPRFSAQGTPPKTTMTYDLGGRPLTVTNELSHVTTFTYDNQNNVLTSKNHLNHTTTSTYDAKGKLLTVTDANTNVTTYVYDDADRLIKVTDAEDGVTTYGYDANRNRTAVTNANREINGTAESGADCGTAGTGNGVDNDSDGDIDDGCPSVLYTYDNLNLLATQTDALANVWSYSYDDARRLSTRTDPESQVITYGYNKRNELTSIDYPVGTTDISFQYDDAGNRTQMVDASGTTTYVYDAVNRLTSATFPGSRVVGYAYDKTGNLETLTYPGSDDVTYEYDEAHNLTSVTDWNTKETTYTYDNAGLAATATLANGIVTTFTYDNADRLTGISHDDGLTTVKEVTYTLDGVGIRTQRVDGLGTHTYAYDDLYRQTSVTYPGPSTDTYTYDAVGNRLTKNTDDYTYDAADRLTDVEGVTYDYDDNGNLTDRGSDSFVWDAADRLTSATVSSVTTTFVYNGGGLRDSLTTGGNTTTFTWDVARSIPQLLDDGHLRYTYGLGRVSQIDGSEVTHYYLSDALGSTMALTDASKTVVNDYEYDVFGAVSASSGSLANDFEFTGEQTDDSTDLQYLRARYYDPSTGRFVSRDPISGTAVVPGTANRYAYVLNNPANLDDPSGLCVLGAPCPVDAIVECVQDVKDCAEDIGIAAAQTVELAAYGGYVVTYTALDGLGGLPDPIEVFFLPLELQLTAAQARFLAIAAGADYVVGGDYVNTSGTGQPATWWPDWLENLLGGDSEDANCWFPCTVLPGISENKEGEITIDFQWPLGN